MRFWDEDGDTGVQARASSRNLTNLISNEEDESNGLVKAWAQINADGTIEACWRCNRDPLETQKLATGIYEVDFTRLGTDIAGRPELATINAEASGTISLQDRSTDTSSVLVATTDGEGILNDQSFVPDDFLSAIACIQPGRRGRGPQDEAPPRLQLKHFRARPDMLQKHRSCSHSHVGP